MMALEGGSVGFQIGGQATDFVLLVMNGRGAHSILSNKVKLGADASVAAGPKGRTASADTDVSLRAEVLSYSRSRGLFAVLTLDGGVQAEVLVAPFQFRCTPLQAGRRVPTLGEMTSEQAE